MNKKVKKPCVGCVYFKQCGSTTRTADCKGRKTKSEMKREGLTMKKEEALKQIAIDEENIKELKELRGQAFNSGDRKLYDQYTRDIKALNEGIKALNVYSD